MGYFLLTAFVLSFYGALNFVVAALMGFMADLNMTPSQPMPVMSGLLLLPTVGLGIFAGFAMHRAPLCRWLTLVPIPIGLACGMVRTEVLPTSIAAVLLLPFGLGIMIELGLKTLTSHRLDQNASQL